MGLWLMGGMFIFFWHLWSRGFLMRLLELIELFKKLGRGDLYTVSLFHCILKLVDDLFKY